MKKYIFATAVLVLSACQQQQSNFNIDETLDYCSTQVERALVNLRDSANGYDFTMEPRNILNGDTTWNCRKARAEEWCSGFWPGVLWMS